MLGTSNENVVVPGNINVNGITTSSSYNTSSDYRIKQIIEPLNSTYNVHNLHPIKYVNTLSNNIEIGFLAHEVQQIFPYLVTGEKDGEKIQTLNYTGLIGILVQEIKELKETQAEHMLYINELKETQAEHILYINELKKR